MQKRKGLAGQGLIEYALILAGVALAVFLTLNITGMSIRDVYCQVNNSFGGTACDANKNCSFSFESASELDAWEGSASDRLTLENGKACITGDGKTADSYLNPSCSDSLPSDDYSITLSDVTVNKEVGNKNTGFDTWFRAQDDENGYLFIYNTGGNYVRFWKIVNGKWIRLAHKNVPASWNTQELNFRIDIQGDTFTAYQGGEMLLQTSDSAYPSGQVGIRNKPSSKSCIGGISVENIPSEEAK